MGEAAVLELLRRAGALITESHIVYASGKHGSAYVNKDAVYLHPFLLQEFCKHIARAFRDKVQVVAGPEKGGILLSQWVAWWLERWNRERNPGQEVLAVYAEKDGDDFVFRRGYDKLVTGKRVLIVEDVLTTGGSVKKTIDAVARAGGFVVGVGALCNRSGIQSADFGTGSPTPPPSLFALVNVTLDAWDEAECPLCKRDVPINSEVGKGREFLARRAQRAQA